MTKIKMICPACGAEMNQHAVKIDYEADTTESIDPDFGGVLKELHTCPGCGRTEMRTTTDEAKQPT